MHLRHARGACAFGTAHQGRAEASRPWLLAFSHSAAAERETLSTAPPQRHGWRANWSYASMPGASQTSGDADTDAALVLHEIEL